MKVIFRNLNIDYCEYAGNRLIVANKIYDAEETPALTDPYTFNMVTQYIIRCEDNSLRAFPSEFFMSIEEFRDNKLNELV